MTAQDFPLCSTERSSRGELVLRGSGLPAWEINTSVSAGQEGTLPTASNAPRHSRCKPEMKCGTSCVLSVCSDKGVDNKGLLSGQWQTCNCVWGGLCGRNGGSHLVWWLMPAMQQRESGHAAGHLSCMVGLRVAKQRKEKHGKMRAGSVRDLGRGARKTCLRRGLEERRAPQRTSRPGGQ